MWWYDGFAAALPWWLACVVITLAALPLALRCFRGLADRGAGLAPGFGLALTLYMSWCLTLESPLSGSRSVLVRGALLAASALCVGIGTWRLMVRKARPGSEVTSRERVAFYWPAVLFGLLGVLALPHHGLTIWFSVLLLAISSAVAWQGNTAGLRRELRRTAVPFLVAQALFLVGFVFFLNVRSYIPEATFNPGASGAEKFGNLTHLNSIMRSSTMPPSDVWFMGEPINYYYGGHLLVATLAKATGTPARYAFNYGLALIFGLTFSMGFSLVFNLLHVTSIKSWIRIGKLRFARHRGLAWGVFGAFAITFFGNLDAVQQLVTRDSAMFKNQVETRLTQDWNKKHGTPTEKSQIDKRNRAVQRELSKPGTILFSPESLSTVDYWRSSRTYHGAPDYEPSPQTITEFPYFSAILGDMHPHHMAIPFSLMILSAALLLCRRTVRARNDAAWWQRGWAALLLMGLTIGMVFPVNIWDAVVMTPLLLGAILLARRGVESHPAWRWLGFLGMLVLLSAVFLFIGNSMRGVFPPFANHIGFAGAIAVVLIGVWSAYRYTDRKNRIILTLSLSGTVTLLLMAGAWFTYPKATKTTWLQFDFGDVVQMSIMSVNCLILCLWAFRSNSATLKRLWMAIGITFGALTILVILRHSPYWDKILVGARDVILMMFISISAIAWALWGDSPLKRWWTSVGGAYALCGVLALLVILPFKLHFHTPLSKDAEKVISLNPPRMKAGLIQNWDSFWNLVWNQSPINPFPGYLRTDLTDYWVHWGLFAIPILLLMVARVRRLARGWNDGQGFALAMSLLAVMGFAFTFMEKWTGPVLLAATIVSVVIAYLRPRRGDAPLWVFIAVAFFFQFFVEVLHFDDSYVEMLERYNTPFKIMYPLWPIMAAGLVAALRAMFLRFTQSCCPSATQLREIPGRTFAIMAIAAVIIPDLLAQCGLWSAAALWLIVIIGLLALIVIMLIGAKITQQEDIQLTALQVLNRAAIAFPALIVCLIVFCAGMLYPWASTANRTNNLGGSIAQRLHKNFDPTIKSQHQRHLDAIAFIRQDIQTADDAKAIDWLLENAMDGERILEAPAAPGKESYSSAGKFATTTGLIGMGGWIHHELQWRGWGTDVTDELKNRFMKVMSIYEFGIYGTATKLIPNGSRDEVETLMRVAMLPRPSKEAEAAAKDFLESLEKNKSKPNLQLGKKAESLLDELDNENAGEINYTLLTELIRRHASAIYSANTFDDAIPNVEEVTIRDLIAFYDLDYVIVGSEERARFQDSPNGLEKFESWEAVFNAGGTTIYRVPNSIKQKRDEAK